MTMEAFHDKAGITVTLAMIDVIARHREQLSDIDGLIGDGDHGINMDKGFRLCAEALDTRSMGFVESLRILGDTLMDRIGGSMGPLYGMMFRSMAKTARDRDQIDATLFAAMLGSAELKIRGIGQCQEGEKTLLDVLAPARRAFDEASSRGASFTESLEAMEAAANSGCKATIEMIARKGRASRLGERSRGVPDPGASSCRLLLTSMSCQIRSILSANEPATHSTPQATV